MNKLNKQTPMVIKSNILADMILDQLSLKLETLKLLDVFLSRIDTRAIKKTNEELKNQLVAGGVSPEEAEEQSRYFGIKYIDAYVEAATVTLTRPQLAAMLGVSRIRADRMEDYCSMLNAKVICGYRPDGSFKRVVLFPVSSYDKETDIIKLTCNVMDEDLRRCFFDVVDSRERRGFEYMKYQLKDITEMKTLNAARLQIYVRRNLYRKSWTIDVEDLQSIINRKKQSAKDFHRDTLKPAVAQINEHTDLVLEVEPVLVRRQLKQFRFTCSEDRKSADSEAAQTDVPEKKTYGYFQNVFLTEEELSLCRQSWSDWEERIEELSNYKERSGKQYNSDFAALRNFDRRKSKDSASHGNAGSGSVFSGKLPDWYADHGRGFESESERQDMLRQIEEIKRNWPVGGQTANDEDESRDDED